MEKMLPKASLKVAWSRYYSSPMKQILCTTNIVKIFLCIQAFFPQWFPFLHLVCLEYATFYLCDIFMRKLWTDPERHTWNLGATLQLKINCCCPGLQRCHVNRTPKLSPTAFAANGNAITRTSNTGSSTKNNDTGLDPASWTQQQFISYLVLFHIITEDTEKEQAAPFR